MKNSQINCSMLGCVIAMLLLQIQCKTYTPTLNIKVVNLKDTTQNISGAKVSVQGQTETADTNGLALIDVDLDRFILDRIEVSANAKGYKDYIGNILIGKDQQETAIVKLEPRNKLIYIPDSLVIGPNEIFKDITVKNLGLDSIDVAYLNNNLSWISLSPTMATIRSDIGGPLRVTTNISQQNCRIDGKIRVSWKNGGVFQQDTIPVTKIIEDKQAPFASFSVTPGTTVLQNQELTFDASASSDNCEAYFPLEYNWVFDNNNQTGFSPDNVIFKHAYTEIGIKNVSLIVRDGAAMTSVVSKEIHVMLQPTPPDIAKGMTATAGPNLLSVVLSGTIYNFGQTFNALTDYGFVYSTVIDTPTLGNSTPVSLGMTSSSPQQFTFTQTVINLQPKRHYIRAYAKNSGFPAVYSDPIVFDVKIIEFKPVGGNGGSLFQAQRGDDDSPFADQKPESYVYLNNFEIAETEVTNEQYAAYLNGNNIPPNQTASFIALGNNACKIVYTNKYSVVPGFEKHPVVTVSWDGANAFCNWVNGRLPTEAEWEACARAGVTPVYPQWAGSNAAPGQGAVYNGNSNNQLLQVRQREDNDWKLFDMSGNAAEWCSDWYASQYSIPPMGQANNNPLGPVSGSEKVVRGGNYQDGPEQITVTHRNRLSPITLSPRVGFRVVRN